MREFLKDHSEIDFADAEDFANRVVRELGTAFGEGWANVAARNAIRTTTRSIYEFYRLRDTTVFGDTSPVKLRLGGPDLKSIKFIGELDHFYFSKFADNTDRSLRKFFVDRFLSNGALLFDDRSTAFDDFRKAAGDKLANLTDTQVRTIVETATARIRTWAHIASLDQAEVKYARLVATIDNRTSQLCLSIDGKLIRIGVAAEAVQRLNGLEPKEFARELYGSHLAKRVRQDPSAVVREFLDEDGRTISDMLVATGLGFPPFHPNCRTRTQALTAAEEAEVDGTSDG